MTNSGARACVYSQRGTQFLLSRCHSYEFEDVVCEIDRADLIVPKPRFGHPLGHRFSNRVARHIGVKGPNPGLKPVDAGSRYDLFFFPCMFPSDLVSLRALPDWKERADVSICWLEEIWAGEVSKWRGQLRQLRDFDYVFLNCAGSVDAVEEAIGRPCMYLPPGIDAIRFTPFPDPPDRIVDVYSIGRRSPVVHEVLRERASRGEFFYIYDTIRRPETRRFAEHRELLASIAKRSRFFLVDVAKHDRGLETHRQAEVGFRFFEGAAAGTAMIGKAPNTPAFKEYFGWPDAVIELPDRPDEIAEAISSLAREGDRVEKARVANAVNSLRRNDWAHRWGVMLEAVGLEALPGYHERLAELERRAQAGEATLRGRS